MRLHLGLQTTSQCYGLAGALAVQDVPYVPRQRLVKEVHGCLKQWWDSLPKAARLIALYDQPGDDTAKALLGVFAKIGIREQHAFLLEDLQTAYGFASDEVITDQRRAVLLPKLTADKALLDGGYGRLKESLVAALRSAFAVAGKTHEDCRAALRDWYNNLDSAQRDGNADWHLPESRALLAAFKEISDFSRTAFETLPAHPGFGLGKAADWASDLRAKYEAKLVAGKERIEAHRIVVPPPQWAAAGATKVGDTHVYRKQATLEVAPPDGEQGLRVFITENGSDPRLPGSARSEFAAKQTFVITDDNQEFQFVACDDDGRFSQVVKVAFGNEDRKHRINAPEQPGAWVRFAYPTDAEALRVTLESLIAGVVAQGIAGPAEAAAIMDELKATLGAKAPVEA